jgi:hypothetical protein
VKLLLSELKKNTPEFHSDYANLTASVEHIQKIASHINESKHRFENANQVGLKLIPEDEADNEMCWTSSC